ncbi:hypothetical protein [Streptomyces sp. CB01881]|uniref:hypothetical protein n=1 Tax=Streptomyces sp. CB01881 TaxID=2078691 RepID=UPI0011DFDA03|nr:hypothetical protein [Streptomyces sp. CB01881]TYC74645.1 hypothetical protein EH183_22550 [Streptomyces sp. CB01881]
MASLLGTSVIGAAQSQEVKLHLAVLPAQYMPTLRRIAADPVGEFTAIQNDLIATGSSDSADTWVREKWAQELSTAVADVQAM